MTLTCQYGLQLKECEAGGKWKSTTQLSTRVSDENDEMPFISFPVYITELCREEKQERVGPQVDFIQKNVKRGSEKVVRTQKFYK